MDFSWDEQQEALRQSIVDFAEANLNNGLTDREHRGEFPRQEWSQCAAFGIQSLSVPSEYNTSGVDTDLMSAVLAMQALGYGCRDNGLNLALAAQMWTVQYPISTFGTDDQKRRFLPGLCGGDLIGAHAVTEEAAGSDHLSLTTTAVPVQGGYLLTGAKRYITLGPIADLALVFATTDPHQGRWGLTALLVETDSEGCERGPTQAKMGLRTVPLGELQFDDCFVPASNRLGPEGAGASISSSALGVERCFILATYAGTMERQLEEAVDFARSRRQFGQAIGKFQAVSNRIADMKLALETSQLLLYKVAWMLAQDESVALESALLKLLMSEAFLESSLAVIRTQGGGGYLAENEVERDLRDAVGGLLYAGTNDIQRNLVARMLGL